MCMYIGLSNCHSLLDLPLYGLMPWAVPQKSEGELEQAFQRPPHILNIIPEFELMLLLQIAIHCQCLWQGIYATNFGEEFLTTTVRFYFVVMLVMALFS